MRYQAITKSNVRAALSDFPVTMEFVRQLEWLAEIIPFRTNTYVINELIDWTNPELDPIFRFTMPSVEMLGNYAARFRQVFERRDRREISSLADEVHVSFNPHPASQVELNIPDSLRKVSSGIQQQYKSTVLFFPKAGQICHAYCSYCFRWPQFLNDQFRFAEIESSILIDYLKSKPDVTDVIFTGGDPMTMSTQRLRRYIEPILQVKTIRAIRIGTKACSYWPYRYTHHDDSKDLMRLFSEIVDAGKHLTLLGHYTHPKELKSSATLQALKEIRRAGATIRSQAPVLRGVNDSAHTISELLARQVGLGIVPYYLFVERPTGPYSHFRIPLGDVLDICREGERAMSGLCKSIRAPVMSTGIGKVHLVGKVRVDGSDVFVCRVLQARDHSMDGMIFMAKYSEDDYWVSDLKPIGVNEEFRKQLLVA